MVSGRQNAGFTGSSAPPSVEEEENEDTEPRCSFCEAPFPNIDA